MRSPKEVPGTADSVEAESKIVDIYDFLTDFEFPEDDTPTGFVVQPRTVKKYFLTEDVDGKAFYVQATIMLTGNTKEGKKAKSYNFNVYASGNKKALKSRTVSGNRDDLLMHVNPLEGMSVTKGRTITKGEFFVGSALGSFNASTEKVIYSF
jgi:hypothetical protein